MRLSEELVAGLRARGDLWEPAPGLVGLRGETLAQLHDLEMRLHRLCLAETVDEWRVPEALPLHVLERADYFASFPHWLSLVSHLSSDATALECIARSATPAHLAARSSEPASAALPPAVCYHVYTALADSTLHAARTVTAQGTCWRHEGERLASLERGWAFTMREIVFLGSQEQCVAFCDRGIWMARTLLRELGLAGGFEEAEDPFFAPTGRGRALLQRLKGLKQELRLSIGGGETIAAASFNLHEQFFGEAFDIRLADGSPAFTACVAFGLERWLLAMLVAAAPVTGAALIEEAVA